MSSVRCVVDTNVLISALISPKGKPNAAVRHVLSHGVFFASPETFWEFESRIQRPKFRKYVTEEQIAQFVELLRAAATFVEVTGALSVCADPDDDKFLEVAVSTGADYLITGNIKDFPSSSFQAVAIVTPAEFLDEVV